GLMLAAFLAFSVARAPAASAGALQQTDAPLDGPHVLITGNINVRGGPGTGFTIVAVARPGQRYTITGQNADGTWWRIDYLGEEGWLYAPLVQAVDAADVPVVEPAAPAEAVAPTPVPQETAAPETDEQASDQATVAILRAMNVRSGPGTSYRILAVARPGQRYAVTGQDAAGAWWRIDLDGQPAWV